MQMVRKHGGRGIAGGRGGREREREREKERYSQTRYISLQNNILYHIFVDY